MKVGDGILRTVVAATLHDLLTWDCKTPEFVGRELQVTRAEGGGVTHGNQCCFWRDSLEIHRASMYSCAIV